MDSSNASAAVTAQATSTTAAQETAQAATTVVTTTAAVTTTTTQPSTTTDSPTTTNPATTDSPTTTITTTTTTTTNNDPNPTTQSSTRTPSDTTTQPNNNSDTTSSSAIVTSTKNPVVSTSKEITTSSAIPVVTVTSSGNSVYTYTTTSYSAYVTSVPTLIEQPSSSSTTNTGVIVGCVVGGVAFVALIGAIGFFMLRKKNKKIDREATVNTSMDPPSSRPFVPAYDPSKEGYGHYNYESPYPQPSEPMIGYEPYPASETVVSYESPHSSHEPMTSMTDTGDRKESEDIFALNDEDWAQASGYISDNDFDMIDKLSAALDQVTNQLEERQREFVIRSTEWTTKTREKLKIQTQKLEERRSRLLGLLVTQYHKIDKRMNRDAKTVQLRDKISFVVGVGNSCVAPALAIRYPNYIPAYYSVQMVILLILRYVIYRSKRWHYFVFDMCYFVNLMTMLFLWVKPDSSFLLIATFAMTNGPVAWAIITWRNSLVFHSLDKVTSVFIHILPPLVMYCLRWMPELLKDVYCDNRSIVTEYRDMRYPAFIEVSSIDIGQVMIYSTVAYSVWQALYYVFIMVGKKEKVDAGLRLTSYSWLLNDTHGKKGFIQKTAFLFGEKYKLEMFMLLQLIYNVITSVPTYYLYQHFWIHTTFLIGMFAVSVWNGANYYIEVFSRRYIHDLDKIK